MSFGLAAIVLALTADPAASGTIRGRVVWSGDVPDIAPLKAYRPGPGGVVTASRRPAPNVPRVDPASHGVAGALVILRGKELTSDKAWPHPAVAVELHDDRPMVVQGGERRSIGVVRRGDAVTFVSRQTLFHSLRARGAAFWTLAFPDPDKPLTRRFDKPGLVDLASGAGHYWMQGYLWVSDHPFVAVTDSTGRFEITEVPAGKYELTSWLPNWRVVHQERDPESTAVARLFFDMPLERTLHAKSGCELEITLPK